MKVAKTPFFKKGDGKMDSARMHRSISPDKYGSGHIHNDHCSHHHESKGTGSVGANSKGNRDMSNNSYTKSVGTVNRRDSPSVRRFDSQGSNYDRKDFNPIFFKEAAAAAKSELGSTNTAVRRKMSKEVEDRLFGRTVHQCKTRLCSVFHFGTREKKPVTKRANSVLKDKKEGRLRFATITNKDWALSEIYQYVRKEQDPNTKNKEDLEENFK